MKDFSKIVFTDWTPNGKTLVEASAGTGKTYNIQNAYLRLVLDGYPVTSILVVTFTEAATAELRDRLRTVLEECRAELVVPKGEGRAREALEGARRRGATDADLKKRVGAALDLYDRAGIYTIHGFCNHVLTQYAFEAGHESDGELLQNADGAVLNASRDWWRQHMYGAEAEESGAFAGGFGEFRAKVRQRVGHPDAVFDLKGTEPEGGEDEAKNAALEAEAEALKAATAIFARQRRERNELTYDAMLTDLREALRWNTEEERRRSEALKTAVRRDYKAALIDEFQDTDRIQYEIFTTLFEDGTTPLLFVGDPKQAIYRFRGGDIYTYKDAKAHVPETRRHDLETNYRSEAPLLEAINAYFGEQAEGTTFGEEIPYKALKSGAAERGLATLEGVEGGRFVLWRATYGTVDEMRNRAYEATADEIVRLLKNEHAVLTKRSDKPDEAPTSRRLQPEDFAVLTNKNLECEAMLDVLRERGVNAVCVRESDLRETDAAKGMRWILRAMASPGDVPALRAALGVAFMPSTRGDLEALARGETLETVTAWSQTLKKAGECWERNGFMRAWKILKEELGLQQRILEQEDGEQLAADLEQTAEWLHLQGRAGCGGPQGLLQTYEAWLDGGEAAGDGGNEKRRIADDAPAVRVMTIHKSKGLQFPVVFVPTLWGKTFGEHGRKNDYSVYHKDQKECLGMDKGTSRAEETAEARRQAYVALTRAMNRLYVVDARLEAGGNAKSKEGPTLEGLTASWEARNRGGGIEEVDLPKVTMSGGGAYAAYGTGKELEEARPMPKADRGNGRTSFSGMTRDMHGGRDTAAEVESEAEDRDEADGEEVGGDVGGGGAVRSGIFALPGGTQTGSCIHELFERLDFGDAATHGAIIGQMLKRYGLEAHRGAVERMVETVLDTELPGGGGKLRDAKTRIAEMTFDFPMRRAEAATLSGVADVLDAHWAGDDPWKREFTDKLRTAGASERAIARGYMTGAIDLVFRAGGKFHLADWKTNRLGGVAESFGEAGLRAEMKACLYPLQYLVYLTALDGILRERLEDYDYERDIGRVYYLFVRGMDGTGRGVYVDRPGRETVEALGNYLRGGGR